MELMKTVKGVSRQSVLLLLGHSKDKSNFWFSYLKLLVFLFN